MSFAIYAGSGYQGNQNQSPFKAAALYIDSYLGQLNLKIIRKEKFFVFTFMYVGT